MLSRLCPLPQNIDTYEQGQTVHVNRVNPANTLKN
jgi:hypothetical protein